MTEEDPKPTGGALLEKSSRAVSVLRRRASEVAERSDFDWLTRFWPEFLQEAMARRGWAPPTRILGLDLDGDQVFAVELRRRRGVVEVQRADEFSLPAAEPTSGAEPSDLDASQPTGGLDAERAKAVLEELDRRGFHSREVATVLSREHTFQRVLHLPPATPDDLEAMAVLKSERELPVAAEEACTDFLFLPRAGTDSTARPTRPEEEEGHLVVVCAAATASVTAASRPWTEAGLQPRALDVVGQSAFRALRAHWQTGDGVVCLLLVRKDVTELVIGGRLPLFTRAVFPGGSALEEDVHQATALVGREVVRSLRAFSSEFPNERVGRVVLVSRYLLDREALEEVTGLPVTVPAGVPDDAEALQSGEIGELKPEFAPALGVAWQELTGERERVNFLTPWKARRRQTARYRHVKMAVLASAVALLVVLMPVGMLAVQGVRVALVERKFAALGPEVRRLEEVKSWLDVARPWTGEGSLPLEVLGELTGVATADVYLRTVSIGTTGAVTLEGYSTSPEAAYRIRDRLAAGDGVLTDVTYVKGYTGKDAKFTHEFTLTAQVRGWSTEPRSRRRR